MRKLSYVTIGFTLACLTIFYWKEARLLFPFTALLFLSFWKWHASWRRPRYILLGLCLGLLWAAVYEPLFGTHNLTDRTVRLEAVAVDWPEETTYGRSILVDAGEEDGQKVRGILYTDETCASVRPGDRIFCIAHCTSSRTIRGEESIYYTAKGIELFFRSYGEVTTVPQKANLSSIPALTAGKLRKVIDELYPEEQASLLHALLLGRKSGVSSLLLNCFNRVGVSHVLVVSGLHVSFLAGFLLFFLRGDRKISALVTIGVVFFFAAMTGGAPGSIRAAILCSAGLLAPLFGRRNDPATSLSAALLVLLLYNPNSVMNAGLQFSFVSTAGIYCFGQPLYHRWMEKVPRSARGIATAPVSVLAISLGALVFTLPLSAFYFGNISLIAPLTNLCTAWAVSASFLGGILSVCAGLIFLPLGNMIAVLTGIPLNYFVWCSGMFNRLTFANLPLNSLYYQAWFLFVYAIGILYCLWRGAEKRYLVPICACIMTLCLSILLTGMTARRGVFTLSVLDVGQGQSVVLRTGGYTALVDCGGSEDAGKIAADYLQAMGTSNLDLLILTHYHADHANGVEELMSRLKVKAIALPDTDSESELRHKIEELATAQGARLWYIQKAVGLELGTARLTLYEPQGAGESNEEGLAVLCSSGTWDALLTGDMDMGTEERLLKAYELPDLELLVAGHHGSRFATGDVLLEETRPETVVISVGYNTYGHPNERLLERLQEQNITVYRTDRMGTVTVRGN